MVQSSHAFPNGWTSHVVTIRENAAYQYFGKPYLLGGCAEPSQHTQKPAQNNAQPILGGEFATPLVASSAASTMIACMHCYIKACQNLVS